MILTLQASVQQLIAQGEKSEQERAGRACDGTL